MVNRPKRKGTSFETEVKRALGWPGLKRTPPGTKWDIEQEGPAPIEVLATRSDRGKTLVSLPLSDFAALYEAYVEKCETPGVRIECKRYARGMPVGMLHKVFEEKFSCPASRQTKPQGELEPSTPPPSPQPEPPASTL